MGIARLQFIWLIINTHLTNLLTRKVMLAEGKLKHRAEFS